MLINIEYAALIPNTFALIKSFDNLLEIENSDDFNIKAK